MDISSMLEVQVKEEGDVKEATTPGNDQASGTNTATAPISQEENNYYKLMFGNDIATVRFRRLHCTACDVHIGSAPAQAYNMFEHPILRTLLCSTCRDFYGDGCFEQGDDATDMFCRWCANGGNLYCCSYCSNTFCYKCIRRNFSSLVRKKIEADEKWKCFVCYPGDLYNARAVCWALLQHVQTVTRILAHDKKMTSQEIEEKMNLDETSCCPRRNKRKRRRLESNSEEEDETYSPKVNGMPTQIKHMKRKPLRRYRSILQNGTMTNRMLIPIRPRPTSFLTDPLYNEQPNSMISQTNSTITPSENIVLSPPHVINSNTSLPSRFDSNALQQQPLYHTSFMNASGSATYIQTPVPMNRIILPSQSQSQLTYQPQQAGSYQPQSLQSSPNTMVSIPNPVDKNSRPLFIIPKPKDLGVTLTPNIIDLDSDSDDELKVVEQQNNLTIDRNSVDPDKVVPVALTWENNDEDGVRKVQPLRVICSTRKEDVSFSRMMLPHNQELDKLLSDTKEKMCNFFDVNNSIENIEIEAQQRIKHFYSKMRDTVFQLVHINDKIVRKYIEWRRYQKTETETSSVNENTLDSSQENVDIPLDMTCVNDSDTESECENQRCQIVKPSDLIKDNNIIKDLLFYRKNVVHRGVGDDSVHFSMDKAIQVYDIVSRDYEKSIGYSVLTKTAYNSKTDDNVLDSPVAPDKNFGKYEEQFIYYLQHIEDNGIETEDMKSLADSDETSFQEVQTDPLFISHLFQDTDLPIVSTDQLENCEQEKNIDLPITSTDESKNCQQEKSTDLLDVSTDQLENCEQEKNIDLSIASTDQSKNCQQEKNINLSVVSTDQLKNCEQEKNIDLPITSTDQYKNCQQEKNIDLPVVSTDQLENCEQEKNIDLPITSIDQSKNCRQEKSTDLPVVSTDQLENCEQEKNIDLPITSTDQLKNCQQEKNIDLPVVSTDQSKNCQQETNFIDSIDLTKDDKKLNKNNTKIVDNSVTKIQEIHMHLDDKLQQTELQKTLANATNEKIIVIDNEANSNKDSNVKGIEVIASSESEEDCTIIDD